MGGPDACIITAHDARTGAELWRRRTIPAPGEPGDETWGGVPFEERVHVGTWMPPSYDPELRLIYQGTSVTSPAPKFMLGGVDNTHLYHNSTLALDVDTGEIRWYYQHLNDHWDLDHPFERILVDIAVAPDPEAVSWINPRLQPGEVRKVMTGIPGKTGIVYTLDRETGEFLWATPTVAQNVISDIDGATGAVTVNSEVVFTAYGQEVLACPTWAGGKDWEAGAYSPLTNTMYFPLRNTCARMLATDNVQGERERALTAGGQPPPCDLCPCRPPPAGPRDRPARDGSSSLGGRRARRCGSTNNGRPRIHWSPPAAGSSSVAMPTGASGLRPRDRRCAVGDQPRLTGHGVSDHLCRRRTPVCGRQHRHGPQHQPWHDTRAPPELREQPVRVRAAGPRLKSPAIEDVSLPKATSLGPPRRTGIRLTNWCI